MSAASKKTASTILRTILFLGLVVVGCQSDDPVGPGDSIVLEPGSVNIDASAGDSDAPWFLLGPGDLVEQGVGDDYLDNLPAGQYRLGWGAVPGWRSPATNPELQALGSGAEITFSATYTPIEVQTGSIAIDATPDEINAPWVLTGPSNFYLEGNGDQVIDGREPGTYTITWQPVPNYQEQSPSQAVLEAGGRIDLGGSYIYQAPPTTGTILVDAEPNHLNAPWSVSGPDGYQESGNGDVSLTDIPTGDYVVSFGTVSGWYSPAPSVRSVNLTDGELETVTGTWVFMDGPAPGDPQITGVNGDFSNGGVVTISGSDFGTHSMEIESGVGPDGWIEANSQGTRVNQLSGGSDWASYATSQPPFVDGSRSHSGSKAINASVNRGADGDWNKVLYYEHPGRFDKIYATWWVYFDPISYADGTQWKMWRVSDGGDNWVVQDNCASLYQLSYWGSGKQAREFSTFFQCKLGCAWPAPKQCTANVQPEPFYQPEHGDPYMYHYHNRGGTESYGSNLPTPGTWARVEMFLDASDPNVSNGRYWLTIDKPGQPRKLIDNWVTGLMTRTSDCCEDQSDQWKYFTLHGYFDDNGGSFQNERADLFYDDIYLQFGTSARVELGNHENFTSCTQLEVQEAVSWSNGQISVKLNRGGFSASTPVWLFVVTDDGSVSQGRQITLQ